MTIFVTGGACFIGSNFVLDWLTGGDEPVVNLDALTYADNLENISSLTGNPIHIFVAESHVDRSIHGPEEFIQTDIVGNVVELAKELKPSPRGELEITDLNRLYLEQGRFDVEMMGRGCAWLDTGTHDSLLEASQFIAILEKRQGFKVACPEETAWRQGWIDTAQVRKLAESLAKNGYGKYLMCLLKERVLT